MLSGNRRWGCSTRGPGEVYSLVLQESRIKLFLSAVRVQYSVTSLVSTLLDQKFAVKLKSFSAVFGKVECAYSTDISLKENAALPVFSRPCSWD